MRRPVLLVTGLSGAGRGTALRALEDLGFQAIDNVPLFLLPALLDQPELFEGPEGGALAVGIDSRTRGFSAAGLADMAERLRARPELGVEVIFLTCSDEILVRRFTETRRRHPLAGDRPVGDGIAHERRILAPIQACADHVIDTTETSIHDLRRLLTARHDLGRAAGLHLTLMSFAYRHGIPREADFVIDVRFLANPHWEPGLRAATGIDHEVQAYVTADPAWEAFLQGWLRWFLPVLQRYREEGRRALVLAFGCTGGRHRSVTMAEKVRPHLVASGFRTDVIHRDLPVPPPAETGT